MKLSEAWLREWVNPPLNSQRLADQLTMGGFEVEAVTSAAPSFHQVVVGEIKTVAKHPEADRLHVCRVDVGRRQALDIVCGGINVRPGLKVAVVLVGGEIANGVKIKKAALRGVTSEGMICASRELGLTEEDEKHRILELPDEAPLGVDLRQYLSLDDTVMEINITPNRGDCLSVCGMAREVGALNRRRVKKIKERFPLKIAAKKACPHYVGRVIRDINTQATTPIWMRERLRRSGLRSLHPVVDVMNYVLLEWGQPLHAFDLEKLKGGIEVRYAKAGEALPAAADSVDKAQ